MRKTIDLENLKKNAELVKAFKWYVSDDSGDMYTLVFRANYNPSLSHRELAAENNVNQYDLIGGGYVYFDKVTKNVLLLGAGQDFSNIPTRSWSYEIDTNDIASTLKELIPIWNEKTSDEIDVDMNFSYASIYVSNYSLESTIEEGDAIKIKPAGYLFND
jgi:hypothetical protein